MPDERTLEVHIGNLRRNLDFRPGYKRSCRVGYRFTHGRGAPPVRLTRTPRCTGDRFPIVTAGSSAINTYGQWQVLDENV